jgi:hypothetical protein
LRQQYCQQQHHIKARACDSVKTQQYLSKGVKVFLHMFLDEEVLGEYIVEKALFVSTVYPLSTAADPASIMFSKQIAIINMLGLFQLLFVSNVSRPISGSNKLCDKQFVLIICMIGWCAGSCTLQCWWFGMTSVIILEPTRQKKPHG